VILTMPTNLRGLVDAGVALGVPRGGDPRPALEEALDDAETRRRLDAARRAYLQDAANGVDGRATERLLAVLREAARTRVITSRT
jgi:hypothetical protein